MFVTLESRTPCALCGFRARIIMCGSARVNRRSMRTTAPTIGATGYARCPECGTTARGELSPRSPYLLVPEDARRVAEYRERRWPETAR